MIKWVPKIKLLVIIMQLSYDTEIWHKLCPTRGAGTQCHMSGKGDSTGVSDCCGGTEERGWHCPWRGLIMSTGSSGIPSSSVALSLAHSFISYIFLSTC